MLILPSMYQSTIFGTSVRPRAPPKAVPFQTRPVTSWNGRVAISLPASATPMMIDSPQPRWQHSSAWRMTSVLPVRVEGKIGAAAGEIDDRLDHLVAPDLFGIDEMRHAELLGDGASSPG